MPEIDSAEAGRFLKLLLEDWHEENWVLLWQLQGKRSLWSPDLQSLLHTTDTTLKPNADYFVGVSLSPENFGPDQRCPADKVAGLLGFVADVDIEHPVHKGKRLPAAQSDALALLGAVPLQPTAIVHSGHGLQAWWCFREPWILEDDEERTQAQKLSADWGATLQEVARRQGYSLDSVFDLARVMRLPGTVNNKNEPLPVSILQAEGPRYNPPHDFEDELLATAQPVHTSTTTCEFTLSASAEPPANKFSALLINSTKFKDSWEHAREDLRDTSPSGYDLSLAATAVLAEWKAQEIINLLIAHRRKHSADLKLNRPDYYQKTLDIAFAPLKRQGMASKLHQENSTGTMTDDARLQAIKNIGRELNINLVEIEHVEGEQPLFRFHIVKLGRTLKVELTASRVKRSQAYVQDQIFGHTGEDVETIGKKLSSNEWRDMAQFFYTMARKIAAEEDSTADGAVVSVISDFLRWNPPQDIPKGQGISDPEQPFKRDGRIWISAPALRQHAVIHGIHLSARVWIQRMQLLGAESQRFAYEAEDTGRRTTTSLWGVPEDNVQHTNFAQVKKLVDEIEDNEL